VAKIFNFFEKRVGLSIPTLITIVIVVVIVRWLGILQTWEWAALDSYFRLRDPEPISQSIVIVGLTTEDVQKFNSPISDAKLAELLEKIKQQNPRAIGLDLYRDKPVPAIDGLTTEDIEKLNYPISDAELLELSEKIGDKLVRSETGDRLVPSFEASGYLKLIQIFRTTPNLVGIRRVLGEGNNPPIPGPPGLKFVSSNEVIVDRDRILRRGVLYPSDIQEQKIPTLGLLLANLYLAKEKNVNFKWVDNNRTLQFGSVKLTRFSGNDGGYVKEDDAGYQMLLNYQAPAKNFPEFSFSEVLSGKISEDSLRDKIVFIGNIDYSAKDIFYTPYTPRLPEHDPTVSNIDRDENVYGVYIQANLANSIVRAVLEERPLIKVWPQWVETLSIIFFAALSSIVVNLSGRWVFKRIEIQVWYNSLLFYAIAAIICTPIAYGAWIWTIREFNLKALWLPIVPIILAISLAYFLGIRDVYASKIENKNQRLVKANLLLEESKRDLDKKVELRSLELEEARKRIAAEQHLNQLRKTINDGISHQIKNPLNILRGFIQPSLKTVSEIEKGVDNISNALELEDIELFEQQFLKLKSMLADIKEESDRITDIITTMKRMASPIRDSDLVLTDIKELLEITVERIVKSYHSQTEHGLALRYTFSHDPNLGKIKVIPSEISEAIANIVDNSCYAILEKATDLEKKVAEEETTNYQPSIDITTQKCAQVAKIYIRDNGIGIKSKDMKDDGIFAQFTTTKPSGKGTGLGLYIARELINKNRGSISCRSQRGQYTEFTIELPLNFNTEATSTVFMLSPENNSGSN